MAAAEVVVIGGGHNGLVRACYLARAWLAAPEQRLRAQGGRRPGRHAAAARAARVRPGLPAVGQHHRRPGAGLRQDPAGRAARAAAADARLPLTWRAAATALGTALDPVERHQLLWFRPSPSLSGYRTPIGGLFLTGAGTHPGGGVTGLPGRNAAAVVLDGLGAARGSRVRRLRRRLALVGDAGRALRTLCAAGPR